MDVFILAAAFAGGFIDAVAGGGGLIQVPALFATYGQAPAATLLGTVKISSISGTSFAFLRFRRQVQIPWKILQIAIPAAFLCSLVGAWIATQIDSRIFRIVLPVILSILLVYIVSSPKLGTNHQPIPHGKRACYIALLTGIGIGLYDGILGPGTGSFLMFIFVRLFGFDFLHASVTSKLINVSTNLAAIILFSMTGHVWWKLGLMMAVANIAGNWLGSILAMRYGSRFIRYVFLLVILGLIIKTSIDATAHLSLFHVKH